MHQSLFFPLIRLATKTRMMNGAMLDDTPLNIFYLRHFVEQNQNEPLSFRTWCAFTCSGLPIWSTEVEKPDDSPEHVAAVLFELINTKQRFFEKFIAASTYSELVANHPNQVARGAYAITLVASLINGQNYELARGVANSYVQGERFSCCNLSKGGQSFHELAVRWLDDGRYLARASHVSAQT